MTAIINHIYHIESRHTMQNYREILLRDLKEIGCRKIGFFLFTHLPISKFLYKSILR